MTLTATRTSREDRISLQRAMTTTNTPSFAEANKIWKFSSYVLFLNFVDPESRMILNLNFLLANREGDALVTSLRFRGCDWLIHTEE